jgi:hypothetical protein
MLFIKNNNMRTLQKIKNIDDQIENIFAIFIIC